MTDKKKPWTAVLLHNENVLGTQTEVHIPAVTLQELKEACGLEEEDSTDES